MDTKKYETLFAAIESKHPGSITEESKRDAITRLTVAGATEQEISVLADAVKIETDVPTGANLSALIKELRRENSGTARRAKAINNCGQIIETIKGRDKWSF